MAGFAAIRVSSGVRLFLEFICQPRQPFDADRVWFGCVVDDSAVVT